MYVQTFSSQLFQCFDNIILLSHGRALYYGPGGLAPAEYFSSRGIPYTAGYNVADYLLDVASDPPVGLFQSGGSPSRSEEDKPIHRGGNASNVDVEKSAATSMPMLPLTQTPRSGRPSRAGAGRYATTFLTQLEVLSGREWMILRRDKTLFLAHMAVSCVLGVFVGKPIKPTHHSNPPALIRADLRLRWAVLQNWYNDRWLPVKSRMSVFLGTYCPHHSMPITDNCCGCRVHSSHSRH